MEGTGERRLHASLFAGALPTSHSLPGFASASPASSSTPTPLVLRPGLNTVFVPLGHVLTVNLEASF